LERARLRQEIGVAGLDADSREHVMDQDASGFEPTTGSVEAARHLRQAIDSFNQWRCDMMDHVEAALAVDGDCPMAHAVKGLALTSARNARFQPMIDQALAEARAGAPDVSERERLYIAALEHSAAGRLVEAVRAYEAILARHPTDLFAHRLAQTELFWMGEAAWMRDVGERAAPAWSADMPGYPMFLSVRSFGREEALEFEAAERFGRAAVEIDPCDAWGAHAVAHTLLMQNRIEDGIAWLEPLTGNWAGKNQIVHHVWWHLCLFLLAKGDHERVLALYDQQVRNPDSPLVRAVPDAYIDVQNCASLLLALELRGVPVGDRWDALAEVAEGRIDNPLSPFTSAHAAIILAANERYDRAGELIRSMRDFGARDPGPLGHAMRVAAVPAAEGAVAHRKGDHQAVVAHLMPARHELRHMGGSHAQRDIFFQILTDSCRRLQRADDVATLLDDIARIGFADVAGRRLYADAAALLQ
jgi:tetratricopeptide (TPR) repeat protein